MNDELVVRVYNVGFGDCIYVEVPDKDQTRHILIDCGTVSKNAAEFLREPLIGEGEYSLKSILSKDPSGEPVQPRLDLLVVTHPHADHIAGFGYAPCLNWFKGISIGAIWLNAVMVPDGKSKAKKARELRDFAARTLRELSRVSLTPALDTLVGELMAMTNDPALTALRATLPGDEGPLYVDSDTPVEKLHVFDESTTRLRVLNPAKDIDGEYAGQIIDAARRGFESFAKLLRGDAGSAFAENWGAAQHQPANISPADFRQLRSRLMNNALAFAKAVTELANDTSVVLLLEWRGLRLLFTGDVQFDQKNYAYAKGVANRGWNVLWHYHEEILRDPLDFLKVGHHGSKNATPWVPKKGAVVNEILDALIGREGETKKTHIVVSTRRNEYGGANPDPALMKKLGQRAANAHTDYREYDHYQHSLEEDKAKRKLEEWHKSDLLASPDVPHPARTDLEYQTEEHPWGKVYVEVRLKQPFGRKGS